MADDVIRDLGLAPHPEGGWYRETWREAAVTAIYYLLKTGERSHWHRVDATEIWHFYDGDPLELAVADADGRTQPTRHVLGPDHPQHVVAAARVAVGPLPRTVEPGGVHRLPRVHVRRIRVGGARMGARRSLTFGSGAS